MQAAENSEKNMPPVAANIMEELSAIQANLIRLAPRQHLRFLAQHINWQDRLVGIVGARGTGKTTLLLQHLANLDWQSGEILYFSADHVLVEGVGLYDIAATFFRTGGRVVAIDEVHKRTSWAAEIKSLYDAFPTARFVFTGSCMLSLELSKADLSRRAVYHSLPCLSFREYITFETGLELPAIELEQLLRNHVRFANSVLAHGPILGLFHKYLTRGAYPFFLEGKERYLDRLGNVVEKVLYEDIPASTGIRVAGVPVLKRLLWIIATTPPFELNVERLSSTVGVAKQTVYHYLEYLERAGLLASVLPEARGNALARKPAKLFVENSNLLRAIARNIGAANSVGTVRETFFVNQLRAAGHNLRAAKQGDFLVNGEHLFEIGGATKTRKQIKLHEHAQLVKDDVEVGSGKTLPLWTFGFLY